MNKIVRVNLKQIDDRTEFNELKKKCELSDYIEFKVSPFAKIGLLIMIIGVGLAGGVYAFSKGNSLRGGVFIIGSIAFYLLLYFISHKPRDKKYIVNRIGINIDDHFFDWNQIEDLHLTRQQHLRGYLMAICFRYKGIYKRFELDSMTKSTSEILQILYMYQRLWLETKNGTINRFE